MRRVADELAEEAVPRRALDRVPRRGDLDAKAASPEPGRAPAGPRGPGAGRGDPGPGPAAPS
jgi:hypothetical protein